MSPIRKLAGYTVLAKIGEGAKSEIYAVQDAKTKQVWALKYVVFENEKDDRFLEQAQREYAIGSKLSHPAIRKIRKIIKKRKMLKVQTVALLMELVDANTLDQQLPRSYEAAIDIFRQVSDALAHMHERGFVHADMKPTNVLITEEGQVKVIDLGQACPIGTIKKRIQGTPGYMAPEQATREAIDERTDVFNLGAMMYWVLAREVIPTAMPPQGGSSPLASTRDVDEVPPPKPPHEINAMIPKGLSELVLQCVEKSRENRPESMLEVLHRLDSLLRDMVERDT
ncbi:MAG: serine/threonine protein kinase [Planctomycetes bacterium]|jgi:serine/threonine-protein kinase|nr:serine/threonine protein kinase [Planctomycetota bacterium]MCP4838229.1 serine/threonine protein kinase [Planctomycetota bacterium]